MRSYRNTLLAVLLPAMVACSSGISLHNPVSDFYCDNFLVYEMCARDMDQDGEVELVYFTDTNEVFLYRDGSQTSLPLQLSMHPCAQPMNEDIVRNTSRLFYISEDTGYFERNDIKGSLMLSYVNYLPRVATCNGENQAATDTGGDEFDFEFEF